jgi:hypothetical protein
MPQLVMCPAVSWVGMASQTVNLVQGQTPLVWIVALVKRVRQRQYLEGTQQEAQ